MVSGILGINPRVMWPTLGGGTKEPKAANRRYFHTMMEGQHFVWRYWTVTVLVIWSVWMSDIVTWLFEPEVLVPLLVGLFGPFIALWFANRERNIRMTENYFYKTQVLVHMYMMLDCAILWLGRQNGSGMDAPEAGGPATVDGFVSKYRYHRDHVEMLNVNTFVPANVRYFILNFVHALDSVLIPHRPLFALNTTVTTTKHILWLFDIIDDLEYFTADRDPHVRDLWAKTKQRLGIVRNGIANVTDPAS